MSNYRDFSRCPRGQHHAAIMDVPANGNYSEWESYCRNNDKSRRSRLLCFIIRYDNNVSTIKAHNWTQWRWRFSFSTVSVLARFSREKWKRRIQDCEHSQSYQLSGFCFLLFRYILCLNLIDVWGISVPLAIFSLLSIKKHFIFLKKRSGTDSPEEVRKMDPSRLIFLRKLSVFTPTC